MPLCACLGHIFESRACVVFSSGLSSRPLNLVLSPVTIIISGSSVASLAQSAAGRGFGLIFGRTNVYSALLARSLFLINHQLSDVPAAQDAPPLPSFRAPRSVLHHVGLR